MTNELVEIDVSLGPPRPEKLTVDFFEEPDGIVVRKRRGGGPGVFLLLWLIAWTVGCVMLAVNIINAPSLGMFLFALPFWASWLLVAGFLVWIVFGTETLLLRPDKALFLRTALIKISSRWVPRAEIKLFRECRSNVQENDVYLWGIEMVTLGKPLRFAFRLPDGERAWIIHQLNRYLTATGSVIPPEALVEPTNAAASPSVKTLTAASPAISEALDREHSIAEPPTDSKWLLVDDSNSFAIYWRGRLAIGSLVGLLFVNAFWNSIVCVFVCLLWGLMPQANPPQGIEWWALFVFLIPFEVIGLAMFAALVLAIFEPFHHTSWRFEFDRVERESSWPLCRRSRGWQVVRLGRLDLRCASSGARRQEGWKDASSPAPFELAFVSAENADLCSIKNLTEGEARWIGGLILGRRERWFSK